MTEGLMRSPLKDQPACSLRERTKYDLQGRLWPFQQHMITSQVSASPGPCLKHFLCVAFDSSHGTVRRCCYCADRKAELREIKWLTHDHTASEKLCSKSLLCVWGVCF